MPDINTTRYPLDYTGLSPDNAVDSEQGVLADKAVRSYTPRYTPFFTESVIVVDADNNQILIKGVDYKCLDLVDVASEIAAKEICTTIVVLNELVSSNIRVTYQTVGGVYQDTYASLSNLLTTLAQDGRAIWWEAIPNRPTLFAPAEHLHSIGQGIGFEYLVDAIDRLGATILVGDELGRDGLRAYIDSQAQALKRMHWDSFNDRINQLSLDTSTMSTAATAAKTSADTLYAYIQQRGSVNTVSSEVSAVASSIAASKAAATLLYP